MSFLNRLLINYLHPSVLILLFLDFCTNMLLIPLFVFYVLSFITGLRVYVITPGIKAKQCTRRVDQDRKCRFGNFTL